MLKHLAYAEKHFLNEVRTTFLEKKHERIIHFHFDYNFQKN